jgi:hypothetical protein
MKVPTVDSIEESSSSGKILGRHAEMSWNSPGIVPTIGQCPCFVIIT